MSSKCFAAYVVLLLTALLASSVTAICYNDTDCGSPEGVVRCNTTSGTCECLVTCYHMPEGINGTCALNDCTSLDDDDRCRDGIKSRLTALLLSIFLINFGAANFYIERYELAAVQLFLGLLLCCVQVGACAMACRRDNEGPTWKCIACCSVNALISLTFFAWWIADLVIFATNQRNDGDGCPLYT